MRKILIAFVCVIAIASQSCSPGASGAKATKYANDSTMVKDSTLHL